MNRKSEENSSLVFVQASIDAVHFRERERERSALRPAERERERCCLAALPDLERWVRRLPCDLERLPCDLERDILGLLLARMKK